jgi:hypothetical protein
LSSWLRRKEKGKRGEGEKWGEKEKRGEAGEW